MRRYPCFAGPLALALALAMALALLALAGNGSSSAQTGGQEKTILPMIKANWVAFRNFGGRQWVYFTMLQSYRCGLSQVRFSINNDGLGEYFPMPPCDPQRPNAIDAEKWPPYITMSPGTAKWMVVQLVYADGEESEPVRFGLCNTPGDSACAVVLP